MNQKGVFLVSLLCLTALWLTGCADTATQTFSTSAPAPTIALATPQAGEPISNDQFDALSLPVAIIADLEQSMQMPYPTADLVSSEYANAYLFDYVNAAFYERQETFDGLPNTDYAAYVALKPEEVNALFLTAFNGRVDTTNFIPNQTSCLYYNNRFYVGIDRERIASAQYIGQAAAAFDPAADYLYTTCYVSANGTKKEATYAIGLMANPFSETGYCITCATLTS